MKETLKINAILSIANLSFWFLNTLSYKTYLTNITEICILAQDTKSLFPIDFRGANESIAYMVTGIIWVVQLYKTYISKMNTNLVFGKPVLTL